MMLGAVEADLKLVPLNPKDALPEDFVLGVAIRASAPEHRQLHVGILFRDASGALKIGDVRFHFEFDAEPPKDADQWFWVLSPLRGEPAKFAAATLEQLVEQSRNLIPYSVANEGLVFADGKLLPLKDGQGLTCSTFVQHFFDEVGYPILTLEGWVEREGDAEWKALFLKILSGRDNITPGHIEAQRIRLDSAIRVRPEDVYAATLLKTHPANFPEIEPLSAVVSASVLSATKAAMPAIVTIAAALPS